MLAMFSIQPRMLQAVRAATRGIRPLATHASTLPSIPARLKAGETSAASTKTQEDGQLRPHLNIEVDPNHGLYAFFRRKEKDGAVTYETVEAADPITDNSGRSWTAAELRRKSFKDLHTLWYILLRERNLLYTQLEEGRRLRIFSNALAIQQKKLLRCRKSMARIKYVINERRLAYDRATEAVERRQAADLAKTQERNATKKREVAIKQEAKALEQQAARKKVEGEAESAARIAGDALFATVQSAGSQEEGRSPSS